jgi:FAD synthase
MEIRFITKIRDEQRFASLEELRLQLAKDRDLCISMI